MSRALQSALRSVARCFRAADSCSIPAVLLAPTVTCSPDLGGSGRHHFAALGGGLGTTGGAPDDKSASLLFDQQMAELRRDGEWLLGEGADDEYDENWGDRAPDGKTSHRLFEEQMAELKRDREWLFGEGADDDDGPSSEGCERPQPFRKCMPTIRSVDLSGSGRRHFTTTGGDGGGPDGKSGHRLFEEQMAELRREREGLLGEGVDDNEDVSSSGGGGGFGGERSEPFGEHMSKERLEQLHEDRAALFAFTDKEKEAWVDASGSGGGEREPHIHSAEFMEAIRAARESRFEIGGGEEEEGEKNAEEAADPLGFGREAAAAAKGQHETFTHLTAKGDSVSMVDVGSKVVTRRVAKARSVVVFPPEVMEAFGLKGDDREELVGPKGPIFATAKIAGIMGAKRTSELIPLCHPLPLDRVHVDIFLEGNSAIVECECRVTHKTGVEMEALAGASIAALTIYDMVKAVSHRVRIEGTALVSKTGGKRNVGH